MFVMFQLEMIKNNAWNNKWTGYGNFYARTRTFTDYKEQLNGCKIVHIGNFTYDFGDGWIAKITTKEVSHQYKKEINDRSQGFSSYDWMIDSIIKHLKIISTSTEKECPENAIKTK